MRLLAVLTNTTNTRYFRHVLSELINLGVSVKIIDPYEYIILDEEFDVIIYNTFPDESHPKKFKFSFIKLSDEKFLTSNSFKILFDSHDNGTRDGFSRFYGMKMPRIKVNPSVLPDPDMNIIIPIPYIVYSIYKHPSEKRIYPLVCAMAIEGRPKIRQITLNKIKQFNPITEWLTMNQHAQRLCKTLVNVVPTGWGDSSLSHTDTLAAGALLFTHEDIKRVNILPYADLIDGVNFVSYNEDNVGEKLEWLFSDIDRLNEIRLAGLNAYHTGYDPKRSAEDLLKWKTVL